MIELYAAGTSNGLRARMGLEECGLPYRLHLVNPLKGETKTPEFLKLNPDAQIPVIVDPDGPEGQPVTMSQSAAILLYAAEKSRRLLPARAADRPAFLQAYMNAATDMSPTLGSIFAIVRSPEPHQPSANIFKSRWNHYLGVWNEWLGRHRYAAGGEYTIADISLFASWWRCKGVVPELVAGHPNLDRWGAEVEARPAIQRALKF